MYPRAKESFFRIDLPLEEIPGRNSDPELKGAILATPSPRRALGESECARARKTRLLRDKRGLGAIHSIGRL